VNIFAVHRDPTVAAKHLCDPHVVKMISESTQMLATAHGGKYGVKPTHEFHPCTQWAMHTRANYRWLVAHALSLCEELEYRFGTVHVYRPVLRRLADAPRHVPSGDLHEFVQAMPDAYKCGDSVTAYRRYYRYEKLRLLRYTRRTPPTWLSSYVCWREDTDDEWEEVVA
jgi:hypothetical protein